MPYIYNAKNKAQELTVKFQKNDSLPLSITATFFSFLTKQLETIFASYQYDETVIINILQKISLKKIEEITKLSKAVAEIQIIMKLKDGDVEVFEQAIRKHKLEKEAVEEYAQSARIFVRCHLLQLSCELGLLVRKQQGNFPIPPNKKIAIEKEGKYHPEPRASMLPMWNKSASSKTEIEQVVNAKNMDSPVTNVTLEPS